MSGSLRGCTNATATGAAAPFPSYTQQSLEKQVAIAKNFFSREQNSTTTANSAERKRGRKPLVGRSEICEVPECEADLNNTPQRRTGPGGSGSLCNACGQQFDKLIKEKARRLNSGSEFGLKHAIELLKDAGQYEGVVQSFRTQRADFIKDQQAKNRILMQEAANYESSSSEEENQSEDENSIIEERSKLDRMTALLNEGEQGKPKIGRGDLKFILN
jgi:hypothetical protein